MKTEASRAQAEADYHQFLYDELAAANLDVDEQEQMEAEQQRLEHAEEIKRNLLGVVFALQDNEVSAITLLKEALQQLQQAERYMPSIAALAQRSNHWPSPWFAAQRLPSQPC